MFIDLYQIWASIIDTLSYYQEHEKTQDKYANLKGHKN